MIYEYCLVVDRELNPYPTLYEDYKHSQMLFFDNNGEDKPEFALLSTNSVVGAEAAEVLYGMNLWRLSISDDCEFKPDVVWHKRSKLFRRIVSSFDFSDLDLDRLRWISEDWFVPSSTDYRDDSRDLSNIARGWHVHEDRLMQLTMTWDWKKEILEKVDLESLTFDLTNCFCPSGCCRTEVVERLLSEMGEQGTLVAARTATPCKL